MRRQEKAPFLIKLKEINFASVDAFFSRKVLHRDTSEIIVYLSVLCYALVFSYFTILKFNAFSAYAWDLGIFNQSMWTTLHSGQLFVSTVEQFIIPSGVFFGTHFSPILFVVLPFYALTSSPQTLLVFQSFILALGAVPLYFFAKNSLNNKVIAVVFSLAYLLYPPLQGVNWFDFHVQAFLPLFFFCAFYFLAKENFPGYFLFVFLALTVAENVPITVVFLGIYCFWRFRKRIVSAAKSRKLVDAGLVVPILTIVIAATWLFFSGWIRQVNWPFNSAYTQLYKAVDHWSVLGIQDDPNKLPLYVITQPGRALEAFGYDSPVKLLYLFLLFGPLLFLSLGSSITVISLAWLVPALLSNYTPYYTIGDHFPAYVVAFIFLGAVEGLKKISLSAGLPSLPKLVPRTKTVLVVSLVFALLISPLSLVMTAVGNNFPQFSDYHLPKMTHHDELLQTISDMVPGNASVLTQNAIFAHFSSRADAYVYPLSTMIQGSNLTEMQRYVEGLFQKSEYVMTDTKTDKYTANLILSRITDTPFDNYTSSLVLSSDFTVSMVLSRLQTVRDFGLVAYGDGIYLFEKDYSGQMQFFGG